MSYVPHGPDDVRRMLDVIGVESVEDLFAQIPQEYRLDRPLDLPPPLSEWETARELTGKAAANEALVCFLGGGSYDHFIPAVVDMILRRASSTPPTRPTRPRPARGRCRRPSSTRR